MQQEPDVQRVEAGVRRWGRAAGTATGRNQRASAASPRGPLLRALVVLLLVARPIVAQEAEEPPAPAPDYVRTSLEIGAVMATGLGIYFYKGDRNEYDWPLSWERVKERFTTTRQFRFDDNEFAMNNVAHPVAGALYYRFARTNGFGPLGASLFTLGGSTFWEVVVELREIASVNDLVATPATGIALGEALYQHQAFFRRGRPSWRSSVLEKLLGGPILINRLFGEVGPRRSERLDANGFPADRAHRFRVYGGPLFTLSDPTAPDPAPTASPEVPGRVAGPAWMTTLGVTSEISSVEPRDDGGVHETGGLPVTRLEAHVSLADPLPTEFHLAAESVLGGWRGGAIRDSPAGPRGQRWMVGPSTAFTMRIDQVPGAKYVDLLAVAHVVGLRGDWVGRRGGLRARWTAGAFADFASVRPLGMERFRGRGIRIPKGHSVLWWRRYYYAWGGTLRGSVELELGRVGIRHQVDHHVLEAIQGPHRHQDRGPGELSVSDTRTYGQTWLELRPTDGLIVGAGLERWWGTGTLGTFTVRDREARLLLRLSATP